MSEREQEMRTEARKLVNECLFIDLDDPSDYRREPVGWDAWQDFVNFAESVMQTCEILTWGRLAT